MASMAHDSAARDSDIKVPQKSLLFWNVYMKLNRNTFVCVIPEKNSRAG
jgi:hypothetical protein